MFPTRLASGDCGHSWAQTFVARRWLPEQCPTCHPPPEPAVPRATRTSGDGYSGDILEDLRAAGVNVWKYGGATLDSFDASEDPEALDAAQSWIAPWREKPKQRYAPHDWMYLYGSGSDRQGGKVRIGGRGHGKTYLAVAIARELVEAGALRPERFRFRTAEEILLESEATFRTAADDSEKKLLSRYERPDLLVIDDFGVRDPSPHAIRLFDELTKKRECKATIWTSNLSLRVLVGGPEYVKRIVDRIAGECGDGGRYLVKFTGHNRRLERARRAA